MLRFYNNSLSIIKNWKKLGINALIGYKKRTMIVSFQDTSKDAINNTLESMFKSAKYLDEDKDYTPLPEVKAKYEPIPETYDKRIEEMDNSSIYVEEAINEALDNGAKRVAGTLEYSIGKKILLTSTGIQAEDKGTNIRIAVRAFVDSQISGHWVSASRILSKFDPVEAGKMAGYIASLSKKKINIEQGKYIALLSPLVIANLIGDFAKIGASAYMIDAGMSFLSDKINKQVASDKFTLYDDGRMVNGPASTTFDDEGIPTQRTVIVEKGIFKNMLHNSRTARKFKTVSTGNAGWIFPHAWNLEIEAGTRSLEDLIAEVDKGIFVTNNWYTRYQNMREGLFSTICRDNTFYIENGEIKGLAPKLRVVGKMIDLLSDIVELSKDRTMVVWWEAETPVLAPYILFREVSFTKAQA